MEFGIEKCDMLSVKLGKRETTERIELANHERIMKIAEKENYKYLGMLEADAIKQAEMKEKIN